MTTHATAGAALGVVRAALEANGSFIRDRNADSLMASCPLHDDATPSLSVTWKPRAGNSAGAVLMHCFSCQAAISELAGALGLRLGDLFDDPYEPDHAPARNGGTRPRCRVTAAPQPLPARLTATPASRGEHRWKTTRVYTYTTAAGIPVQQVARQECGCDGSRHKRFQQRYRHLQQWVYRKPPGFTPVLYRAAALRQAAATGRPVWLTEGEKDADSLTTLGQLATTNAQGAASFPAELAAQFTGLTVIIAADRDLAGYERAMTLHDTMITVGAHATVVLPAITAEKADVTDHITERRWRGDDEFGGFIPVSPADLDMLRTAAQARAAAARAETALAEAIATHAQHGPRANITRWLTEAAQQRTTVHRYHRHLHNQPDRDGTAQTLAAQQATARIVDALARSYHNALHTLNAATHLERTA